MGMDDSTDAGSTAVFSKNIQLDALRSYSSSCASNSPQQQKNLSAEEMWLLINALNPNAAKKAIRTQNWTMNHPIRKTLWKMLCRRLLVYDSEYDQMCQLYRETVPNIFGKDERHLRDVPLPSFIDRSLMQTYFLNDDGVIKLKKVTCVLSYLKPAITFSPYLYPVVALMLHYIDDEAECFACIDALLIPRKKVRRMYLSETQIAWKATGAAIREILKKRLKSTRSVLNKHKGPNGDVQLFDDWMNFIFRDLPFAYLVRIMDCFLYEGMKVLFRTSLALIKLYAKRAAQQPSTFFTHDAHDGMSEFCHRIADYYSVEQLLTVAFAIPRLSQHSLMQMIQCQENNLQEAMMNNNNNNDQVYEKEMLPKIGSKVMALDENTLGLSITDRQFFTLWNWLPARFQLYSPKLLFTTDDHGTSLTTFFNRCQEYEQTVVIVKTSDDDLFGVFCSCSWQERLNKHTKFFGTGETFVFTLNPKKCKYPWVGMHRQDVKPKESMFLSADAKYIVVGGGGGQAIRFDDNLQTGRTEHCQTFDNPPLASSQDFICRVVEVYGLVQEDLA